MTPIIPSSISNISLFPGTALTSNKNNCLTRCYFLGKSTKQTSSPQRFLLPLSTSVRLFPQYRSRCTLHRKSRTHILSATGTDVAVEQSDSSATEDSGGAPDGPSDAAEASEEPSIKSDGGVTLSQPKRARASRKSEMPPVKNEELVPGATFTGKVRSIQPFGAFVDFGAFTDGLVHVSRLSDSYVKDVGNIVSLGQEVKVRLVEVNTETGRISLTMRDSDDPSKPQQRKDASATSDKPRTSRRNTQRSNQKRDEVKKTSKFVKGQDLEGTVKNLNRAGAFISLPEGEEGFLPTSEEADEGFGNLMGGSSLQVGQEVSVRVLRISRGQVTLTMKKEEDAEELDLKLSQGVVHAATNPFVLAFRQNKEIATFLDEKDQKVVEPAKIPATPETSEEIEGTVNQTETVTDIPEVQDQPASSDENMVSVPSAVDDKVEDNETPSEELDVGASSVDDTLDERASNGEDSESVISGSLQSGEAVETTEEKAVVSSEVLASEGSISTASQINEEGSATDEVGNDAKTDPSTKIADQILSSESSVGKEIEESQFDDTTEKVEVQIETPIVEPVEEEKVDPIPEENGSVSSSSGLTDVLSSPASMSTGS